MGLLHRIEPFLYSRRNLVGSALGLFGLGMLFLGITSGIVGLGVIAGLYAIGYLVTPAERGVSLSLFSTQDTSDITKGLERLLASIRYRVSDDVFQKVGSIAHSIVMTLPDDGRGVDPADPNVNLVRQTALSYLPEALNAYLAIPRMFAERRPVDGGKTAHDILMDQLNVMDTKLDDVAEAIAKNDTERLLANARFIQERFADSQLELTNASTTASAPASSPSSTGASTTSDPGSKGPRIL